MMKTTKQKLEDWLPSFGWELERIHATDLEWWADEIWELKSIWSPQGTAAYITFLVDPQWEGNRTKGQGVWAVGGSEQFPSDSKVAASRGTMTLRSHPRAEFEAFLDRLDAVRELKRGHGA